MEKKVNIVQQGRKVCYKADFSLSLTSGFLIVWTKPPQGSVFILECVVQLKKSGVSNTSTHTVRKRLLKWLFTYWVCLLGTTVGLQACVYERKRDSGYCLLCIVLLGAPPCSGCFQSADDVTHVVAERLVCTVTCHAWVFEWSWGGAEKALTCCFIFQLKK